MLQAFRSPEWIRVVLHGKVLIIMVELEIQYKIGPKVLNRYLFVICVI